MFVFAIGFANPLMLWGLGAASLPIIIHLLNKRRFREERWAAMRFLLAAIRKNQRRIRIEQWLLLAIRTLLVLLVVSAMAKPFLESVGALPVLAGQRTHRVLVLDGSLSMGHKVGESNRFEQAKELAGRLVKDARQGDAISVVVMGDPPRVVIGEPSPNHGEVEKELAEIVLPHGSTDLSASFQAIDRVLEASTIPQKELVVLTDLQAASWRRGGGTPDQALKRALARLEARRPRSVIIDLGSNEVENRAVTELKLSTPIVTPGMSPPPAITATIRNFGAKSVDGLRVQLLVDGQVGPEETISLRAGGQHTVLFNNDFTTPGEHLIEVRIDEDDQPLDNRRWASVPVREALNVLLVDGDPKPEPFRSESDFLAAALSPEPDSAGSPSPVRATAVPESQLLGRDLSKYDVVALCNIARLTRDEVAALEAFLKQGGGVVVFDGDQVQPDNYNSLLYAGGRGILPAELGPTVGDPQSQESRFEFNPLGFKHAIVADFAGQTPTVTASLTQVRTARFRKLKLPKESTAQVALAFSNGDPAVIAAARERGRVIQVATTADVGWTMWPAHSSYPAIMEQIVFQAASGRLSERNVRVGQPLDQALPPTGADVSATVTRPDGKKAASRVVSSGDVSRLHFEETDLEGPYRVVIPSPIKLDATFSANPDPAESDPAKLDRHALAEAVPGWSFDYRNDLSTLFQNAASVSRRGEVHRHLLWGVLALLVIESVLAWRFGHH